MQTYLPVVHLDPAAISTQIHKYPQRSTQIHTALWLICLLAGLYICSMLPVQTRVESYAIRRRIVRGKDHTVSWRSHVRPEPHVQHRKILHRYTFWKYRVVSGTVSMVREKNYKTKAVLLSEVFQTQRQGRYVHTPNTHYLAFLRYNIMFRTVPILVTQIWEICM